MELTEVLARRRMIRNYTGEPVERAALDRIAGAALRAPSAGFSQGQAVVVVTDEPTKSKIAQAASEDEYVGRGFDPWVSRAGALIVLCVSEESYHRRYQMPDKLGPDGNEIEWPVPYWWIDVGASLMAVLLAVVDEGLGAGFLGTHALDDVRSILGIPTEYTPIGVITVGHPAPDRRSSSLDLGHRPRKTVIHWERWEP